MYSINAHLQVIHQQSSRDTISLVVEIILAFLILAYLLNQFVDFQTYSKTKLTDLNSNLEHQNEMILIQNKENTTLVKEIHHRVKNNLQIIISLLRMQRGELKSDEAKEQFTVAINRILTMSMIHQKLYQEKTPSKISIKDYTKDLSAELLSLEGPDTKIKVEINASDEFAGLKTIVPFGLLLNELISNSIKHAFGEVKQGEIAISLSAEDNEINFQYMDSGKWTEPEEGTEGFGLELIDILTEQLEGTYKRSGSKYEFQFSIES
jgi:two-component sensor histidine kinase